MDQRWASGGGRDPQAQATEAVSAAYAHVVDEATAALTARFGFQESSAKNQRAHLLSLLESQVRCWGGREAAAVKCLERLALEPYARWLEDVELEPRNAHKTSPMLAATPTEEARGEFRKGGGAPDACYLSISRLALWFLVWGEAGNVRFTPRATRRSSG